MVTALQAAIEANPLGGSVTIDGTSISMADALQRLQVFEARLARENGTRPRIAPMDISGGVM